MADYDDEDIFADLYDDEPAKPAAAAPAVKPELEVKPESHVQPEPVMKTDPPEDASGVKEEPTYDDSPMGGSAWNGNVKPEAKPEDDNYGPINVKEDG